MFSEFTDTDVKQWLEDIEDEDNGLETDPRIAWLVREEARRRGIKAKE